MTERIEETISGYNAAVVINLYGKNLDTLDQDAIKVAQMLETLPGSKDIMLQSPPGNPQVNIKLLPEQLTNYGISRADALDVIRAAYENLPVAQIYERMIPVDIAVTIDSEFKDDLEDIKKLPLSSSSGQIVELGDIAQISQVSGRSKILHQGGKRVQTITSNINNFDLNDYVNNVKKGLEQLQLGSGNYFEITGEAQENAKSREDLIAHSAIAIAGVLLMLYIAFGTLKNLSL